MQYTIRPTLLATLLAAALGAAGAQAETPPSPGEPATQAPAQQPSEQELESFANAALAVNEINTTYVPQLEAAATEQERQGIETEAREQILTAIENEGLTVDDYKRIYLAAQTNPEIARRIDEYVRQQMQ